MYLYLNTASIIRILSDVRQNSFTHLLYTYHVFVFLFSATEARNTQLSINYHYDIYYDYILLPYFNDYQLNLYIPILTIFNYPPPPLSSFDLLFLLGVGGARMQKVHEHASITRSGKKKF